MPQEHPRGISAHLMTMKLKLDHVHTIVLLSTYVPTMSYPDGDKEAFYSSFNDAICTIPHKDRVFVLGDFNARVGRDCTAWPKVLVTYSVGSEN